MSLEIRFHCQASICSESVKLMFYHKFMSILTFKHNVSRSWIHFSSEHSFEQMDLRFRCSKTEEKTTRRSSRVAAIWVYADLFRALWPTLCGFSERARAYSNGEWAACSWRSVIESPALWWPRKNWLTNEYPKLRFLLGDPVLVRLNSFS